MIIFYATKHTWRDREKGEKEGRERREREKGEKEGRERRERKKGEKDGRRQEIHESAVRLERRLYMRELVAEVPACALAQAVVERSLPVDELYSRQLLPLRAMVSLWRTATT